MKMGIIGALDQEVELLHAELEKSGKPVSITKKGPLVFHKGYLGESEVVLTCCGVGKVNAALSAFALISDFQVNAIINTGTAGGLAPELRVFDMVASTDAVQHDFDTTVFGYPLGQIPGRDSPFFVADDGLRKRALRAFARIAEQGGARVADGAKMIEGRVASGDSFISDESKRNSLVRSFSPACVEMEGAAIAQVASLFSVPFVILRSISDLASDEAHVSYDDFSRIAALTSARVVIEMLAQKE